MTKQQFSLELKDLLSSRGLSEAEINRSLDYYLEMIDDRIEDGMAEEEAVAAMGNIEDIAKDILFDAPLGVLVKSKIRKGKQRSSDNTALIIILLVLGFPVWFSLLLTAVIVFAAVYIVIFALIISVFAVVVALFVAGIALIPAGFFIIAQTAAGALAIVGTGFLLIGISLLLVLPAKYIVVGLISLTRAMLHGIKSIFIVRKASQ